MCIRDSGQAVGRKGGHLCRREGRAVGQRDTGGKACAHLLRQRGVDGDGVGLGDMALGREDVGAKTIRKQQIRLWKISLLQLIVQKWAQTVISF